MSPILFSIIAVFVMFICSIFCLLLTYVILQRSVGPTAALRTVKLLLISLPIVLPFVLMPLALSILPKIWQDGVRMAFLWGFSAILLFPPIVYFRHRTRSGNHLLTIGYTGAQRSMVVLGLVTAFFFVCGLILYYVSRERGVLLFSSLILWLALSVFCLFSGLVQLQIREYGILGATLITWKQIEAYHWEEDCPTTLTLTVTRRWPWRDWKEMSIAIPLHDKPNVDALLKRYCNPSGQVDCGYEAAA